MHYFSDLNFSVLVVMNAGFEVASRGCCGSGMTEMGILCGPATAICKEPSKFVFWDSIHPSEAAYQVLAESAMNKSIPLLL